MTGMKWLSVVNGLFAWAERSTRLTVSCAVYQLTLMVAACVGFEEEEFGRYFWHFLWVTELLVELPCWLKNSVSLGSVYLFKLDYWNIKDFCKIQRRILFVGQLDVSILLSSEVALMMICCYMQYTAMVTLCAFGSRRSNSVIGQKYRRLF
jgi:hypothetical protein